MSDVIYIIIGILGIIFVVKALGSSKSSDNSKKSGGTNAHPHATDNSKPIQEKVMVCAECGRKYPMNHVYCDACGSLLKEYF